MGYFRNALKSNSQTVKEINVFHSERVNDSKIILKELFVWLCFIYVSFRDWKRCGLF
jgi:hypothetical protein